MRRLSWIDAAIVVPIAAMAIIAMWPTWGDIKYLSTHDAEQSHILLALPIAAWLAWLRRSRARLCRRRLGLIGPVLILIAWAMAAYGFGRGQLVFWHAGAVLALVGALVSVLGADTLRYFAPAFGALAFLVPIPGRIRSTIAIPLQEATARAAHFAMDVMGIEVTRAGNVLSINGHDVAVAEACNGMRMVAALALIGYAFVFSVPMRLSIRILILALSPVIAILVNVIRMIPTVLAYGYADQDFAQLFHDLSGWASLLVALGILWGLLALLRWIEVPLEPYAVSKE